MCNTYFLETSNLIALNLENKVWAFLYRVWLKYKINQPVEYYIYIIKEYKFFNIIIDNAQIVYSHVSAFIKTFIDDPSFGEM